MRPVVQLGAMKWLALLVGLIGALALAAGIVYLTVPAHSLPSIMGSIHNSNIHRTKRGDVATAVGAVLIVVAIVMAVASTGGRRARA